MRCTCVRCPTEQVYSALRVLATLVVSDINHRCLMQISPHTSGLMTLTLEVGGISRSNERIDGDLAP